MKHKFLLSLTLILLLICQTTHAGERDFTYTYQSYVLGKGARELEIWTTWKSGRNNVYRALENRVEFEIGLGKKWQTAFYLNSKYSFSEQLTFSGDSILVPDITSSTKTSFSFSNEWKVQLSSPTANAIGSALYGEVTLSPQEYELEVKVILDKQFSHFVTALNIVGELELESETVIETDENGFVLKKELEVEEILELDYGLAWQITPHFSFGAEVRNHNEIKHGEWEHSALFAGPAFSFKQDKWWLAATVLPQITNLKGGGLELDEHEKINARLMFSFWL